MTKFYSHRRTRVLCAASAVLILGASTAALRAQTTNAPRTKGGPLPTKGATAKKERFVDFVAGQFSQITTPQGEIRTGWGGVVIKSEDSRLQTEQAIYNKKTEIANSPVKLQIDDAQNTVIGSAGTAYYRTRDAVITGQVTITLRPKPEDQNAPDGSARREFKKPATINCTKVEYNWKNRIAVTTGNLTVRYEDYTITADKATYFGANETVVFTGHVHYSRPNGEKGDADKVIAVLKEGAEQFYAGSDKGKQISGKFAVSDEDGSDNAPPAVPPTIPTVGGSPAAPPPAAPSTPAPTVPTPPATGGGSGGGTPTPPATIPTEPPSTKP